MNLLLWTTDLVSLDKLLDSKLGKPGVKLCLDLVLSQREVGIQVKFLLAPLLAPYTDSNAKLLLPQRPVTFS